LADKVHNAQAIAEDRRVAGEDLWNRFNGGKAGTLWYYGALSEFFNATLPGGLSDQLRRHVQAMTE